MSGSGRSPPPRSNLLDSDGPGPDPSRRDRLREYVRKNPFSTTLVICIVLVVVVLVATTAQAAYFMFAPSGWFYQVNEIHTCDTTVRDNSVQVYFDRTSRETTTIDFQIDLERVTIVNGTPRYDTTASESYPDVSIQEGRKVSIIDYPLPSGIVPGMYRFEVGVGIHLPGDITRTQVLTTDSFRVISPGGPGNRTLSPDGSQQC